MVRDHLSLPELTPKQIARFWSKVRKRGPTECWPWIAGRQRQGYGQVQMQWVKCYAHRLAYLLTRGQFRKELCVMHTCDNPPCCNPAHLRLGTVDDNMADMARKGRAKTQRGEAHWKAKLTTASVRDIRRRYASGDVTYRSLATEYGVCPEAIISVVTRKNWHHVGSRASVH